MVEILWTGRADADLQRLYERAEGHSEGAGDRLQEGLVHVLDLMQMFPERWRVVHRGGFRRALVSRTIGLIYRVEARGIIVHAMFDLREDPRYAERLLDDLSRGLPPTR